MAKAARSSEKVPKSRAALTPEAREKQLIALAIDVAEEQMRNGTASSQVISHFLKLGSTRAQIEKELLEKQRDPCRGKGRSNRVLRQDGGSVPQGGQGYEELSGAGG